jgi:hypothetical protein
MGGLFLITVTGRLWIDSVIAIGFGLLSSTQAITFYVYPWPVSWMKPIWYCWKNG